VPAGEDESRRSWQGRQTDDLANQVSFLEQEVAVLRRKLAESPRQVRAMEDRLVELRPICPL
jgi:proteasome-associated ATPase